MGSLYISTRFSHMFPQLPRGNVFLTAHGTPHGAGSDQINSIFLKNGTEERVHLVLTKCEDARVHSDGRSRAGSLLYLSSTVSHVLSLGDISYFSVEVALSKSQDPCP